MTNRFFRYILVAPAIITILITGCSQRRNIHRCSGAIWATTYNITYTADRDLTDSILSTLKCVEQSLSPFDSTSTVSLINRNLSSATDPMLRQIFTASQEVSKMTGGVFDPTLAPIVNLWNFGYKSTNIDPTDQQIDSAMKAVGISKCSLQADTIVKPHPTTEFNFSAITKGYACDMVLNALQRCGASDIMVEIGGEIALSGHNPDGEKWMIQIDAPIEEQSMVSHTSQTVIPLTDCGIATSGNYRNFHTTASGKSWHIINPATGRPTISNTLSATIIAPTCMMADALATSCMILSADSALKMIEALDHTEAMLIVADDTTSAGMPQTRTLTTTGFPKRR